MLDKRCCDSGGTGLFWVWTIYWMEWCRYTLFFSGAGPIVKGLRLLGPWLTPPLPRGVLSGHFLLLWQAPGTP